MINNSSWDLQKAFSLDKCGLISWKLHYFTEIFIHLKIAMPVFYLLQLRADQMD